MNEWGVVLVIISLVGVGSAIITPILKLNTTMVKLTASVDNLNKDIVDIKKDMGEFVNGNHNSHVRIHERIDDCGEMLKKHESRINDLEHKWEEK